jgi:transposase
MKTRHNHIWDHEKRVCKSCGKSLDKAIDEISEAMRKAASDPKVIERGEELERTLSHLTPEDLLRRFDI